MEPIWASERIPDWLFPILAGGSSTRRAETGRWSVHYRSQLDSPNIAGKAALLTFPNRNRFSSCQDWRVIIICCAAAKLAMSQTLFRSKSSLTSVFCLSVISTQTEVASGPSHILASIQASKWTAIALLPYVAAAHKLVASAPTRLAKKLYAARDSASMEEAWEISKTRYPYTLMSFGVVGSDFSKIVPNFRAVLCAPPFSALFLRKVVSASPTPSNSFSGATFHSKKSKLIFARVPY